MALTMTRKSILEPEVLVEHAPGQALLADDDVPATYPNLDTAVKALAETIGQDERLKLRAAKIVQRIRDQELYREQGFDSFSAYLPALLEQVKGLGWTAERTVRNYLAFADVYLDQLEMDGGEALTSATHLFTLLRLADRDRKSGELKDETEKEGKLGAVQFEAVAKVVNWMVNLPAGDTRLGMDEAEVTEGLIEAGLEFELATFRKLTDRVPNVPAGGWTVEDTRELVERFQGKEEKPKVSRLWVAASSGEEVVLATLELYRGDFLINELPLGGKVMTREEFDEMVGSEKVRWTNAE